MKKSLLIITLFCFYLAAFSQEETTVYNFEQGDVFVEGNISFQSTKNGDADADTNFLIAPTIGLFVSEKVAFGGSVLIGKSITEFEDIGDNFATNDFGIGVFGRFYILELGTRFQAYTQASINYLTQKPDEDNDINLKLNSLGFDAGLGLQYFITENVLINFRLSDILGYTTSKVSFDDDEDFDIDRTNVIQANFNIFNNFFDSATFGATYKF